MNHKILKCGDDMFVEVNDKLIKLTRGKEKKNVQVSTPAMSSNNNNTSTSNIIKNTKSLKIWNVEGAKYLLELYKTNKEQFQVKKICGENLHLKWRKGVTLSPVNNVKPDIRISQNISH